MKLIIDIPSGFYKNIERIKKGFYGSIASQNIFNAVANGTPLPKGHGRLIDADLVKNTLGIYVLNEYNGQFIRRSDIDSIPTIIEADGGGEDES